MRWLYLSHRWLGIGMCLLFAMWPLSGVVMMYVGFPELTAKERYAGLPVLDAEHIRVGPSKLLQHAAPDVPVTQFRLSNVSSRPAYLLKQAEHPWLGLYADTGEWLKRPTAEDAASAARTFFQARQAEGESIEVLYQGMLEMDQWTVSSALNSHRPLHKVVLHDTAATWLYVSSGTGQVVRDVTRSERVWNWLGANLHWIYPVQLRKHRTVWANVLVVLTLVGLASVLSGSIIGVMRLCVRRRYRGNNVSPYQGVMKLHHIAGLACAFFLTTFMFSGFMSMTPWGLFDAKTSFTQQLWRYQQPGDIRNLEAVYSTAEEIRQLLQQYKTDDIKELNWHWIAGQSLLALNHSPDVFRSVYGEYQLTEASIAPQIKSAISHLLPDSEVASMEYLEDYDNYYYSHHERYRPLPVIRVIFSDPESTWFHIHAQTGQLLGRLTFKNRVQRWLFNGLHTLDFSVLIYHRPLWDILLVLLCSTAALFSLTSITIAWRRLRIDP
ncbi:MAG: hypothetical protein OXH60_08855 [Rhodospirillales bacterium]|nr:hypothetical protein [Rhodospirillales bacterium]